MDVREPWASFGDQLGLHLVRAASLGPLLVEVSNNQLTDFLGRHGWDNPDGEFSNHFPWDDSLCSTLTEGSLDSVNRERREPGLRNTII